ncbi:MAG: hypothetical protein WEG40_06465 [Candidatus Rokuibacteriota bacterium]
MASPERKISVVPPPGLHQPSALDARLASLEDEATRLRAEVAALQEDMRWLTGEDEADAGWLARGWVRASLLLTIVGVVALVSLPYLLHVDASAPDPDHATPAITRPARVAKPAPGRPAAIRAAERERILVPVRVHATDASEPARVRSADDPAPTAPRPPAIRERPPAAPESDTVSADAVPIRGENP